MPASELNAIEEFDEEIVKELRNRARRAADAGDRDRGEDRRPSRPRTCWASTAWTRTGVTLASRGILTREDLAEQAVDDLLGNRGVDAERAGALIMAARKHWFETAAGQA